MIGKYAFLGAILMLAVFCGAVYSADCVAGFSETLSITVFDSKFRPIDGVPVNVTYQKDRTTGKGYVTTKTQYTDENGTVKIGILNTEYTPEWVKCDVTISAQYDGKIVTKKITAQNHEKDLQMQFKDAYLLSIHAIDKLGAPIANTEMRIKSMYVNTTDEGYAYMIVNKGPADMAIAYLSGVITGNVTVNADTSYTLQAKIYSIKVNVVDDAGNPLVADIIIENQTYTQSSVEIPEIALANPYVKVVYGPAEKIISANLADQQEYVVSFDITPPQIREVSVEQNKEGDIKVRFYILDPNSMASGADIEETTVTTNIKGITQTLIPYAESGRYVVEIPRQDPNTLIRFTINAYDKQGNTNSLNGEYLVPAEETENGHNETGNGGVEPQPQGVDYGVLPWIGGIVVIIILAYVVFTYLRGITESH
jgi:hypothetical protein